MYTFLYPKYFTLRTLWCQFANHGMSVQYSFPFITRCRLFWILAWRSKTESRYNSLSCYIFVLIILLHIMYQFLNNFSFKIFNFEGMYLFEVDVLNFFHTLKMEKPGMSMSAFVKTLCTVSTENHRVSKYIF